MQQLILPDYQKATSLGLAEYGKRRLAALDVRGLACEQGADREQWQFCLGEQRFVMCLEHLCEALWIEPLGRADLHWLAQQLTRREK